ncbi:MAG: DoxX family protein, partial [Propionibacteriaceae bacterium]|nr:DoxX family protein [Propionibacteriaceae bacterium]
EAPARGTTDLALFVARVVTGLMLGLIAVRELFGVLGGGGLGEAAGDFSAAGFAAAQALAVGTGVVGLVAATLLVIGLMTPFAAGALLSVLTLGVGAEFAAGEQIALFSDQGRGLETAILYAALLVVFLFAGPGRWAADRRWGWSYRPRFSGFIWLLLAIVAVAAVWLSLNSGTPFEGAWPQVVPIGDE